MWADAGKQRTLTRNELLSSDATPNSKISPGGPFASLFWLKSHQNPYVVWLYPPLSYFGGRFPIQERLLVNRNFPSNFFTGSIRQTVRTTMDTRLTSLPFHSDVLPLPPPGMRAVEYSIPKIFPPESPCGAFKELLPSEAVFENRIRG